ncbi:MAG: archease [Anaerolineaceae bacterium]|nr:archease [Anaerolineaceae bacterium]
MHTADYAILVWGKTLSSLFESAALGMFYLMGMKVEKGDNEILICDLQAENLENLLVDFLSELLFILEVRNSAILDMELSINGLSLSAKLTLGKITNLDKWVKAVTYHNLSVKETFRGFETNLVFDV